MLVGYMRVSKADGTQSTDLQRDALLDAGIDADFLYEDRASGKKDDRLQLAACLKVRRHGDTLVVWKLDRLGRDLRHLVNIVHALTDRGIGLKVLTGQGAAIDNDAGQTPSRHASMGKPGTKVGDLCTELGVTRQTLYRHVSPTGELRPHGEKLLAN